jgi:hypothetical protein
MSRKQLAMTIAAAALCIVAGSASVSAQQSCGNLYNRVMETYQAVGPQSPQYAQLVDHYNASCLSGSSAMPNSAYSYQQPAPADAGAASFGGEGSGASVRGDHRRRHDDYRSHRG